MTAPENIIEQNGHSMRERIDRLEEMVKRLISCNQSDPSTVAPSSNGFSSGSSALRGVDARSSTSISALKAAWDEPPNESVVSHTLTNSVDGTSLLFGHVQRVDILEILSSLPPRNEMSKLIQWFFDRKNFPISVPPIIHEPTFIREYNTHLNNPSQSNVIWIGLLFSILGIITLAMQLGEQGYQKEAEERFHLYRLRTSQCLLLGDIAKCLPYTVETLRFNATAELNRKDDNSRGLWIMTGVIVRAAVNMGYHRDPEHTPAFSTIEGEYRRRIWLSVKSMDEVASFLSGFPRMTPAINSDAKEPLNVHDWELGEDIKSLPPPRPLSEPTAASYLIIKGRVFHALGEVIDFINGPCPDDYTKVIEIDQLLTKVWSDVPIHMRVDANDAKYSSPRTPADYSKLQLACMYHHGICTLHRRFIRKRATYQPGDISRSRCLTSSLALLEYQRLLQPSWYAYSRTRQMLAPAAMTIALELAIRRRESGEFSAVESDTLIQALEVSVSLWKNASDSGDETSRVYQILDDMLRSYQAGGEQGATKPETYHSSDRGGSCGYDYGLFDESGIDWAWWDEWAKDSGLWEDQAILF
ncbi:hypothetical protein AN2553.2 [Aspergillus nidulans FGSC A4]|nr:hypothetical protein AN2553.2 [Aspergillus nidulans FGSC A4]|eukprot:XP_660157.1 hypothetical protein AN2553.2 [Aspergillus nidulans FGSC A4]